MKKLVALVALASLAMGVQPASTSAQSGEEEVLAVVTQLFDGMRTRDADLLKSLFHPENFMLGDCFTRSMGLTN